MLNKIIEWSLRNQLLVTVASACWRSWPASGRCSETRIDAIPDLSDVQVIVFTEYPGQAPQVVEDQVTYPLTTKMLAVPYAKVVRGYSFFGFSFVYVIFEDGTDLYWARSRVLEYLLRARRPAARAASRRSSAPTPPASAGSSCTCSTPTEHSLAELRSFQDWYLRTG